MSNLIERTRRHVASYKQLTQHRQDCLDLCDEIERLQARVDELESVIDAALDEDFISNGWLQDTLAATEQDNK